jgi:hypothetical protein
MEMFLWLLDSASRRPCPIFRGSNRPKRERSGDRVTVGRCDHDPDALLPRVEGVVYLLQPPSEQHLHEQTPVRLSLSETVGSASAWSTRRLTSLLMRAPSIMRAGSLPSAFGFLVRFRWRRRVASCITPGTPPDRSWPVGPLSATLAQRAPTRALPSDLRVLFTT